MRQTFSGLAKTLTALVVVVVAVAFLCLTEFSSGAPPIPASILLPALPTAPVHQDLLTHSPGSLPLHLFALALSLSLSLSCSSRRDTICQPQTPHSGVCVQKRDVVTGAARRKPCAKNLLFPARSLPLSLLHGLLGRLNPVFARRRRRRLRRRTFNFNWH